MEQLQKLFIDCKQSSCAKGDIGNFLTKCGQYDRIGFDKGTDTFGPSACCYVVNNEGVRQCLNYKIDSWDATRISIFHDDNRNKTKPQLALENWQQYQHIEWLDISGVTIVTPITQSTFTYSSLKKLSVINADLTSIDTPAVQSLNVIDLHGNALTSFPTYLFNESFATIQQLDVGGNKFTTSIPLDGGQCNKLTTAITSSHVTGQTLSCSCNDKPSCTMATPAPTTIAPTTITPTTTPATLSPSLRSGSSSSATTHPSSPEAATTVAPASSKAQTGTILLSSMIVACVVLAVLALFVYRRRKRLHQDLTESIHTTRGGVLMSPLVRSFTRPLLLTGNPRSLKHLDSNLSSNLSSERDLKASLRSLMPITHHVDRVPILPASECRLISKIAPSLFAGQFHNENVVMKRVDARTVAEDEVANFVADINLLGQLVHPQILTLHGIVRMSDYEVCAVVEFMHCGSMPQVLMNQEIDLTWPDQLRMCYEVASGLAYIHSLPEYTRTFCMTSRSVLINMQLSCKLNIFDYMKQFQQQEKVHRMYGDGTIPWEAPEVIIHDCPRSWMSDVYSLGVIMGEIITRTRPFQRWVDEIGYVATDIAILERDAKSTEFPHSQDPEFESCPKNFRNLVLSCLHHDVLKRPLAVTVAEELRQELLLMQKNYESGCQQLRGSLLVVLMNANMLTTSADGQRWQQLCHGLLHWQNETIVCCDGACATFTMLHDNQWMVTRGSITSATDVQQFCVFPTLDTLSVQDSVISIENLTGCQSLKRLSFVGCTLKEMDYLPLTLHELYVENSTIATFPAAWIAKASTHLESIVFNNNRFSSGVEFSVSKDQCTAIATASENGALHGVQCQNCSLCSAYCTTNVNSYKILMSSETDASNSGSSTWLFVILVIVIVLLLLVFYFIRRRFRRVVGSRQSDDTPIMAQPMILSSSRGINSVRGPFQVITDSFRNLGSSKSLTASSPDDTSDDIDNEAVLGSLYLTSRGLFMKTHSVKNLPLLQPRHIKTILPISSKCSLWIGRYKNREVVMKRVHAQDVGDAKIQSFVADINKIALLKHPSITRLYGIARMNDFELCVVAELMSMGSLSLVLQTTKLPLTWPQQLSIGWQIATAFAFLHTQSKSRANYTITAHHILVNTHLLCKLNAFDFMETYEYQDECVKHSFGCRTLAYEAPEILHNSSKHNAATDIFALGVILSSIATRRHPYQSWIDEFGHVASDIAILDRTDHQYPHENHQLFTSRPHFYQKLVTSCLDNDPSKRPSSCGNIPITRASDAMKACCTNSTTTMCAWFAKYSAVTYGADAWGVLNGSISNVVVPTTNTSLYNMSIWSAYGQMSTFELSKMHITWPSSVFDHTLLAVTFRSNLFSQFPNFLFDSVPESTVYTFEDNTFESALNVTPTQCANLQSAVINNQVIGTQGAAITCNCTTTSGSCLIPQPTPAPTTTQPVPTTTIIPTTPSPTSKNSSSNTGLIIGLVIAGIAIVAIAIALYWLYLRKRQRTTSYETNLPVTDEHFSPSSTSGSHFNMTDYKPQISPGQNRLSRVEERGIRSLSHSMTLEDIPIDTVECITKLPSRRNLWSGYFQGKAVAIMRLNTVDVDEESIQNCLASVQLLMACKHP
ncbi:kinase, partial [Thraustotheca clavata]